MEKIQGGDRTNWLKCVHIRLFVFLSNYLNMTDKLNQNYYHYYYYYLHFVCVCMLAA